MKNIKSIQTFAQKKAEVSFRAQISQQHTGGKILYRSELTAPEMLAELQKRLIASESDFRRLKKLGVDFSSCLEIGAEYGVRSALLVSKFNAKAVALDISAHPLMALDSFARKLNFPKLPVRVVADAYRLPFKNNSFSVVFCYQTLHHFPDPAPIIAEIYRVLAPGGYFFFSEEPIRQEVNLRIFRRPTKLSVFQKLLKYILLLPFISDIGHTEVAMGILENSFSVRQWCAALTTFKKFDATLTPTAVPISQQFKNISADQLVPNGTLTFLLPLLGGGISVLARKEGTVSSKVSWKFTRPPLVNKNGVSFYLPKTLQQKLYPNI